MKTALYSGKRKIILFAINFLLICLACFYTLFFSVKTASAMPFYDLKPEKLTTRASFYTSYSSSSEKRKHNIKLASKSINNTFVDVGGEFSFNLVVGERTEKRGYQTSKVIINGEFVDGVGGGICQVSTTLYNAVLLAGLEIVEYHPHSLPVSYVAPSFDAMVNSSSADLKFRNNTKNPIIIRAYADDNMVKITVLGQKMSEKYERESIILESVPIPETQVVFDEKGDYPDIFKGEYKQIKFGKEGYISQGYLIKVEKGKRIKKRIRQDKYNATRGLIVYGNADKPIEQIPNDKELREILQN